MSSESNKEYSVNWKNHMSHVRKAFDHLLSSSELIDVTLCCEGKKIGAHKMLLSACSTYFRDTFKDVPCQHPVIVLYGVEYGVLSDILHFIYNGEVSVDTSKLDSFLKTAQLLQISGLTDGTDATDSLNNENEHSTENSTLEQDEEETYAEAVAAESSTVNDDTKRGVKRQKAKETEPLKDKITRQESETMFITDVKCEPSELVNFEDPLEDPLLQSEIQQNDSREFFAPAGTQNVAEEDFKITHLVRTYRKTTRGPSIERRLDGKFHVLGTHPEGKRKDCAVCSNRKIAGGRKVTPLICETCYRRPSLHVGLCFEKYHTLEDYKS